MRRLLLAAAVLAGLSGPAQADFWTGQSRYTAGDYAGAYAAWLPLAEAGDARAQYSLGVMHRRGLGREKDPEAANAWFERAARQGYEPAADALDADRRDPAKAAAASEAGRVEQALRAMLSQGRRAIAPGAVRVSETGPGAFAVALEGMEVTRPQGGRFIVDALSGRATPVGGDAWRFELDDPPAIRGLDAEGRPFRLVVAEGRSIVVWDETLQVTTKLDVDWRDITVETQGPPVKMRRLAVTSELDRKGGGRWAAPGDFRLEGLESADPGKGRVHIGAIFARFAFAGDDLTRFAQFAASGAAHDPLAGLTELRGLVSDASVEFGVEDVAVDAADGRFRLGDGGVRIALTKLDQPAFDLEIGYRHAGLAGGADAALAGLAPEEARLNLKLARAPMDALLEVGVAAGLEYMLTGELHSAPALAERLREALPAAGTQLRIDDGLFRAAAARITAAGAFEADAAATLGAVGALGVTVGGMDALLAAAAPKDDLPAAGALSALAALGERAADGETLLYRFELRGDGQLLVNGRPLVALIAPD